MSLLDRKTWQLLTLLLLSFIWGTSFILMKKGLLAFPPDVMAALRIACAYIYFLPLALRSLPKLNKKNVKSLFIAGFIGNYFPAIFFGISEQHISSALASMLNATTPIFTWLIEIIFYGASTSVLAVMGIFIGFIGTMGLITKNIHHFFTNWNFYAMMVLIATLFYGINTNEIKHKLKDLDALAVASLGFFMAGPFAIIHLLIRGFPLHYMHHPYFKISLFSIMILAFFSSFIAIIIFNILLKHTSAIFTSSVTYIIPAFGIFWGLLDGEKIPTYQYLFVIITIFGVYLINKAKYSTKPNVKF